MQYPERLITPSRPIALEGVKPAKIMGKKAWDELRQQKFTEHNHTCLFCGKYFDESIRKWDRTNIWVGMELHEEYLVDYQTGRVTLEMYMPTCRPCHLFKHWRDNISRGIIRHPMIIKSVLEHGLAVLQNASIEYPTGRVEHNIKWSDWYLDYEGKQYRSDFKDEMDYLTRQLLPKIQKRDY